MHADWIDLLRLFEKNGVRSLIIGGMAVAFYGHERFTKDLDVWIARDADNAGRVYLSLKEFGAPLANLKITDFEDTDGFVTLGAEPFRVDLLMGMLGVEFDVAWTNRVCRQMDGVGLNYISMQDLLVLKKTAGRPVDKRDIAALKKIIIKTPGS